MLIGSGDNQTTSFIGRYLVKRRALIQTEVEILDPIDILKDALAGVPQHMRQGMAAMQILALQRAGFHIVPIPVDGRKIRESKSFILPGISKRNSSGYRGVYYDKRRDEFRASLGFRCNRYTTKGFRSAEEAAHAYNDLALLHHGARAQLNDV